jgi:nitrogen fixation-related uncharacterized protein
MESIFSAGSLVLLWLLFAMVSPLLYGLVFYWGLRSGQFSRPGRSAFLPLESYIPDGEESGNCPETGDEASRLNE